MLFGRRETDCRQVASLTKIMTALVVFDSCDQLGIPLATQVVVTPWASCLMGTSAELVAGDSLSVEELMYGMLLPSGNDAAQTLGMYFGAIWLFQADDSKVGPNEYLTRVEPELVTKRLA